jgi:SpoVK/Ycf46/Vps4 family AAA+-type ATPase
MVLICDNPKYFAEGLAVARQVEPNRPIVCIFEDIDAIIKRYGEDQLLAILDGTDKIDKVLNIATTNYPEILDKRIISRPRRFDRVYKIPNPNAKLRAAFLKVKLPKGSNVKKWTKDTDGLSFAAMTELIVSVFCLGNEVDATIAILKDMEKGHPNSEDFGTKEGIGFGGDKLGQDPASDDEDDF